MQTYKNTFIIYGFETDKFLQIFFASKFDISVCRGTASTAPVCGLH